MSHGNTMLLPILAWVVLSAISAQEGLTAKAWFYFALFAGVIWGLVLEPIPGPVIGLLGLTMASVLNLVVAKPADSLKWALPGFSNSTVRLIFAACLVGLGYENPDSAAVLPPPW